MHLPAEALNGSICPVTAAVTAAVLSGAGYALYKSVKNKTNSTVSPVRFLGVGAVIFALQMVNFPILSGVSGHFVGGVLAAAALGLPCGMLCMAAVLALQAFLLGDGGVDALGANILNMGIIGAGLGGLIRLLLIKTGLNSAFSTALAASSALILAVFALCTELAFCGKGSWEVYSALIGNHLLLAVTEGVFTVVLCSALQGLYAPQESSAADRRFAFAAGAIVLLAVLLLPLASSSPDGLEWTIDKFKLLG